MAVLKQFIEINRTMGSECWHPECYMIHKVSASTLMQVPLIDCYRKCWNVKLVTRQRSDPKELPQAITEHSYVEEESHETHSSLKERQLKMERRVYRIWE